MFLEIDDLLTPDELNQLKTIARAAKFVDGKVSNPHNTTKNNMQVDHGDAGYRDSSALLLAALQRNEILRDFAFPKIIAPPLMCRYVKGMSYGQHSDAASMMIGDTMLRSDVSCTIFLSSPGDYTGGELTISLGSTPVKIKGKAGSAIVYPSSTLHEVAPVQVGERLVAITFIESRLREPQQRELVYLLNEVHALEGDKIAWENRVRLQHVWSSLLRRWSD